MSQYLVLISAVFVLSQLFKPQSQNTSIGAHHHCQARVEWEWIMEILIQLPRAVSHHHCTMVDNGTVLWVYVVANGNR